MTDETNAGRITDAIINAAGVARDWYGGMGDPLYVLPNRVLVVYGSSDTVVSARLSARDAEDSHPDDARRLAELADAIEPILESAAAAAEDANLDSMRDPYRAAGAAACSTLDALGIEGATFHVEKMWSRGPRVSVQLPVV